MNCNEVVLEVNTVFRTLIICSCVVKKMWNITTFIHSFIQSFGMCRMQRFLLFSVASSIPPCYVLFPPTLLRQLFVHPLSLHLAIYFLVYLSILLFPNSYIKLFWEFYFPPFSVHAQTYVIYLTLLSLL